MRVSLVFTSAARSSLEYIDSPVCLVPCLETFRFKPVFHPRRNVEEVLTFYLQSSPSVSGRVSQPGAASVHTCWVTSPLINIACIIFLNRTHSASIYIYIYDYVTVKRGSTLLQYRRVEVKEAVVEFLSIVELTGLMGWGHFTSICKSFLSFMSSKSNSGWNIQNI